MNSVVDLLPTVGAAAAARARLIFGDFTEFGTGGKDLVDLILERSANVVEGAHGGVDVT